MLLPFVFMAGLTFLGTMESGLLLGMYTTRVFDTRLQLLYNMNITAISAFSALLIGTILGLQFAVEKLGYADTHFGIAVESLHLNDLGYVLLAVFAVSWIMLFFVRMRGNASAVV